ncbi:MAG: YolD-like family protein [Candidatus Pristimantibacillus sp.]
MRAKKLTANGLWESSRMMLPQHTERIVAHHEEPKLIKMPAIHEDEKQEFMYKINESLYCKDALKIETIKNGTLVTLRGVVIGIQKEKIKVEIEADFDWVDFNKIIRVDFL